MTLPRAEPQYFASDERPCFGWLHRTDASAAQRGVGLVICNPIGHEAEYAHSTLRHIAESVARMGMPVLRFDYDGTGDSAGVDNDSERLCAWLRSTHDAADMLRRATGVEKVSIVGVRTGAAIAAECASRRDDVAGVALIAPVVTGKSWLREVKALHAAMQLPESPTANGTPSADLDCVGITITAETQVELTTLNLIELSRAPAQQVLIIDRTDRAPNNALVAKISGLGATVEHHVVDGFVEMMLDPHDSKIPSNIVNTLLQWLSSNFQLQADFIEQSATPITHAHVSAEVDEYADFMDPSKRLFGVVSVPRKPASHRRAILLLNAGAISHIGHGRMYVKFARRWAQMGNVVLRCDIGGVGESIPQAGLRENDPYAPSASDDIAQMVEYVRAKWNVTEVEAVGLCSGGYHGFKAALTAQNLTGVTVINPLTFSWREGMNLQYPAHQVSRSALQYKQSVRSLAKWKKLMRGDVDPRSLAAFAVRRASGVSRTLVRDVLRAVGVPLANDLGRELQVIAGRRVALRFIFATGEPGEDLLRTEAGRSLGRLVDTGAVAIEYIAGPDHSFSASWMQTALMSTVEQLFRVM